MTQCYEHLDYQLLNKCTRVNFLLNAIECMDTGLNTAIVMMKGDKVPTDKKNKFKYEALYLTPRDPVAKSRNTNRKRGAAEIYDAFVREAQILAIRVKQGRGSTRIGFQYYKYSTFKSFYKNQCDEIL